MSINKIDKDVLGFRDTRTAAELLSAASPPKGIKFVKKLPIPPSLRNAIGKAQNIVGNAQNAVGNAQNAAQQAANNVTSQLDSSDLREAKTAANKVMLGATTAIAATTAASALNVLNGKTAKAISSVQNIASMVSLGASIIEETNPSKLVRPFKDGLSINPAQAAKSLGLTAASGILGSLVTGVPLASGMPPAFKIFKTLASLKASPRLYDPTGANSTESTPSTTSSDKFKQVGGPADMLVAQSGLLKDEIMYRLVLLAENVYAPIRDYVAAQGLPPVVILEGFRAENTKISQHERGEAMDITLGDGSLAQGENLYNLAIWCRDHIHYDQIVLCFSDVGGGHAWIHVSFSPSTNRRQLFTKPFNDVHVEGLHHYDEYTDTQIRSADQAIFDEQNKLATEFTTTLAARDALMNPVSVNTPEQASGIGQTSEGTGWMPPPPNTGDPTDPYYWEVPDGVSLDSGVIYQEIRADLLAAIGIDIDDPVQVAQTPGLNCDGPWNVNYWIELSQTPGSFSDGWWWVGWNGYWLSRIVNAVESNCANTESGDRSALDRSKHMIVGSENWPTG